MHVNREAEVSLRTGSTLFLSGVKRVDGDFAAGSVVELVDVRHPERLIGRGSVALPSSIAAAAAGTVTAGGGVRDLDPAAAAGTRSSGGRRPRGRGRRSLLDPDVYKDCRELAGGTSRASQEAFAPARVASPRTGSPSSPTR